MTETEKIVSDHAWKYFEIHANQRITVFNFYIAITGLLVAGIGYSLQQGGKYIYVCSIMGFFMFFISFIFWKLDHRVSSLIKNSELALQAIENHFQNHNYCILTKDKNDSKLNSSFFSNWSYGRCFRISFIFVAITGVSLAIIPIIFQW